MARRRQAWPEAHPLNVTLYPENASARQNRWSVGEGWRLTKRVAIFLAADASAARHRHEIVEDLAQCR